LLRANHASEAARAERNRSVDSSENIEKSPTLAELATMGHAEIKNQVPHPGRPPTKFI
jgi:hypothetical protein